MSFVQLCREFTNGQMAECTKENGWKIRCKGKECMNGLMGDYTKDSTMQTRSTDLEYTLGQMEGNTKAIGLMENSTVKANIQTSEANYVLDFGKMGSVFNGLRKLKANGNID